MGVGSGQALPGGSPLHKDLKEASKEPQRHWGDERSRQQSQMCKGPQGAGSLPRVFRKHQGVWHGCGRVSKGVAVADELI